MDSDNPVVRLCMAGLRAEAAGQAEAARELFEQAWASSRDDFDACVAAHYLARQQPDLAGALRWNQAALDRADAAGAERVARFYPSLYLNLGWSHEQLGDVGAALRCYERAAASLASQPAASRDVATERSIAEKVARLSGAPPPSIGAAEMRHA